MPGSDLKAHSRRLIISNAPKVFFVSFVYLFIISVLSWFSFRLPGTMDMQDFYSRLVTSEIPLIGVIYKDFRPVGLLLALILYLLQPVLDFGYIGCCVKIRRGGNCGYRDIFDGFQLFAKCLLLFITTALLCFLWSLLLIIPGIVAAYRYRMVYYILIDDPGKGVMQCIDESVLMMRGSKADLFIIDLSFLGWMLLDVMAVYFSPLPYTPPLVMIWLAPYRGITNAGFYEYRRSSLTV